MDKRKKISKSIIKLMRMLYKLIPENPSYEVKQNTLSQLSKNDIQQLNTTKKNLQMALNDLDSPTKILDKRIFYAQHYKLKDTLKNLRGDTPNPPKSPTYMTSKPMFGSGPFDSIKNLIPNKTKLINEIMETRKLLRITIPEHPEYSRVCECEFKASLEDMSIEKLNKVHTTFANALKNLNNDPLTVLQTRITVMSPTLNKLKRDLSNQTTHLKNLQDTYQNKIKEEEQRSTQLKRKTNVQIFETPTLTRAQTLKVNKDLKKKASLKKTSSLGSLNKKPSIKRSASFKKPSKTVTVKTPTLKPISEKNLDIQALNEEFNKVLALQR